MSTFNKLKSANSLRRMPKGGPNRSDQINDSFEEILHDLGELYEFVNNTIIPVLNGLGAPDTYTDFNPVTGGLDGKTLLTDNTWADTNNVFFYNNAKSRPKTIKETSLRFSQDIDKLFTNINTIQARLGAVSQDVNTNPATLAEIENQLNFFIGIVRTVQSNATSYLTASGIAAGLTDGSIDPLGPYIERGDVVANTAIKPTDISGVDVTGSFTYSTGEPATYDVADSIMRVKEWVKDISGDDLATEGFANSGLSGDSLKTHREKVGTGTVSDTNPHGLDASDLDDANGIHTRTTLIASFDIKTSGLQDSNNLPLDYAGGYAYAPEGYTVTRVAGTTRDGGTTGLAVGIYVRDVGNAYIYSGLEIPATVPGKVTATGGFTETSIAEGNTIFCSGLSGDAQDCRVFVWGTPT